MIKKLYRLLTVRRPKRLIICWCFLMLFILVAYLFLRKSERVTSSITCKSKLSQIVLPRETKRISYISGIHRDPRVVENDYFSIVQSLRQQCFDQVHIGPEGDGGWEVCLDRQYSFKQPCLVYSFGVGYDFRFERGIEELLGCEVHAFDPSMMMESHQYSERGYFHNIGLDSANHLILSTGWTMRTLERIMKDLGHEGQTIDYLKIDIEFGEWPALYNIVQSGIIHQIRQLAVETHTPEMDIHTAPDHQCTWSNPDTLAFMVKVLLETQRAGFNLYFSSTNYLTQYTSKLTHEHRECCHNLHLVNLKHPQNAWHPK